MLLRMLSVTAAAIIPSLLGSGGWGISSTLSVNGRPNALRRAGSGQTFPLDEHLAHKLLVSIH